MDQIKIENLDIYANHGVFPEENEKGQHFFVNAALYTNTRPAGQADDLTLSTNYGEVCHFMDEFMKENTFQLIETVAERLAQAVLISFPLVQGITIEIRKPEAPIGLPFESVSVEICRGWHKVYVAVGSNMGAKENTIELAFSAISGERNCRNVRSSKLIRTTAYGVENQPDFLNGVMELETLFAPIELLDFLHRLEELAGRKRVIRWGPRTLDLDIIFYDDLILDTEELTIPHSDMKNRDFVLTPMTELNPGFRHPLFHLTMKEMLDDLKKHGQQHVLI